jgi:ABC-type xylose transport system permease subunit
MTEPIRIGSRSFGFRSQQVFVQLGVLPFLLIVAMLVFASLSGNFLTGQNLLNVARQTTYLAIVAMGQMLALLTGGFDLSVGKNVALTSVVGALIMSSLVRGYPDAVGFAVTLGMLGGVAAGTFVGVINGIGIAVFEVPPFMMTLGTASICFGLALTMTSGVPVYGMPDLFGNIFGFGRLLNAGLRARCAHRRDVCLARLDQDGPLLLRPRRQSTSLDTVRDFNALLPVHGLCIDRVIHGDRWHHADRPPRDWGS